MTQNEGDWSAAVAECCFATSVLDRDSGSVAGQHAHTVAAAFQCRHCESCFATAKARAQHERVRHKVTNVIKRHIGASPICACCGTDFVQRPRLVAHLSDVRPRRSRCRTWYLANVPVIDEHTLSELRSKDREAQRAAWRAGHSHPIASGGTARTAAGRPVGHVGH